MFKQFLLKNKLKKNKKFILIYFTILIRLYKSSVQSLICIWEKHYRFRLIEKNIYILIMNNFKVFYFHQKIFKINFKFLTLTR